MRCSFPSCSSRRFVPSRSKPSPRHRHIVRLVQFRQRAFGVGDGAEMGRPVIMLLAVGGAPTVALQNDAGQAGQVKLRGYLNGARQSVERNNQLIEHVAPQDDLVVFRASDHANSAQHVRSDP